VLRASADGVLTGAIAKVIDLAGVGSRGGASPLVLRTVVRPPNRVVRLSEKTG